MGFSMLDKQHLHERLQQLHTELHHLESVGESDRQILQQLQEDIQALLEHARDHEAPQYERLGERLQAGIKQLEASHPSVTMFMGQIVDMLARMGI
jgi:hypothetical protein